MRSYTILRLLLVAFFLYFAWPFIAEAGTQIETIFWGSWLVLVIFVVGGNLATFLHLSEPPKLEQPLRTREKTQNR